MTWGNDDKFLEVVALTKRFKETLALDGVSLNVKKGEVVCLIGPSGCGKSTLLRSINWLEPPEDGAVFLDGTLVGEGQSAARGKRSPSNINQTRTRIGMVFQQFNVWPHMSILENVSRAQKVVLKRPKAEAEKKAAALLRDVGLGDRLGDFPGNLSGGQKQRVAIARALAMDPILMLLDEPTSALDPELVADVLGVLKILADRGMTMLIVTHELGFAARVADRIVFMEKGRIVEMGPPEEMLRTPKTDRLKAFLLQLNALNPYAEPETVMPEAVA